MRIKKALDLIDHLTIQPSPKNRMEISTDILNLNTHIDDEFVIILILGSYSKTLRAMIYCQGWQLKCLKNGESAGEKTTSATDEPTNESELFLKPQTSEESRSRTRWKEAAKKAWKTIRRKKLEQIAQESKKIDDFIRPEVMRELKHPEMMGTTREVESTWEGNGIVSLFHKTPPDIACGKFWELRWAYGCPLDCSYCYLRGTMRGKMKPRYVQIEHVLEALDEAFHKILTPVTFNTGELADSLMNPPVMSRIVQKFEEQTKHKIFLLTKFGKNNARFLIENPRSQVICGWSINAPAVASRWETIAPHPDFRIEAAKLVKEAGYDTRIRIDPIFPIKNWEDHYVDLIQRILSNLTPTRITLGTPRGLWKTINFAKKAKINMAWTDFFVEDTSWGKKLSFFQRKRIYEFMFDQLEVEGYPSSRISICKETTEMWRALKLDYKSLTCNCYGTQVFDFS